MDSTADQGLKNKRPRTKALFRRGRRGLVSDLPQLAQAAEKQVAIQQTPALYEAYSEDELASERSIAERIRESKRQRRLKVVEAAAVEEERKRRTEATIQKIDATDELRARRALADLRRSASPTAQLSELYVAKRVTSLVLAAALLGGMFWSAINVQQQMVPGGSTSDPLFWASYAIEAMISLQLVAIMVAESKVARWNVLSISRARIVTVELLLLALSFALNSGWYLAKMEWLAAAQHGIAPLMIGSILLVHSALIEIYGAAIKRAAEDVQAIGDPIATIGDPIADRTPRADRHGEQDPLVGPDALPRSDRDRIADGTDEDRIAGALAATDNDSDEMLGEAHPRAAGDQIQPDNIGQDHDPIAIGSQDDDVNDRADRSREDEDQHMATGDPIAIGSPDPIGSPAIAGKEMAPIAIGDPRRDRDRLNGGVVPIARGPIGAPARASSSDPVTSMNPDRASHLSSVTGALARHHDAAPSAATTEPTLAREAWFDTELSDDEITAVARAMFKSGTSRQSFEDLVAIIQAANEPDPELPTAIARRMSKAHTTVLRTLRTARELHRELQARRKPRLL